MRIIGKRILSKIKKKNIGNKKLCTEIDRLMLDLKKVQSKRNKSKRH